MAFQKINNKDDQIYYTISDVSELAFKNVYLYKDTVHLLKFSEQFHSRKFEIEPFILLEKIFKDLKNDYGIKFNENSPEVAIQKQLLSILKE